MFSTKSPLIKTLNSTAEIIGSDNKPSIIELEGDCRAQNIYHLNNIFVSFDIPPYSTFFANSAHFPSNI